MTNLVFSNLSSIILAFTEDDDVCDTASEMASTMSERTGYSAATDTSTTMSVQDALNSKFSCQTFKSIENIHL